MTERQTVAPPKAARKVPASGKAKANRRLLRVDQEGQARLVQPNAQGRAAPEHIDQSFRIVPGSSAPMPPWRKQLTDADRAAWLLASSGGRWGEAERATLRRAFEASEPTAQSQPAPSTAAGCEVVSGLGRGADRARSAGVVVGPEGRGCRLANLVSRLVAMVTRKGSRPHG